MLHYVVVIFIFNFCFNVLISMLTWIQLQLRAITATVQLFTKNLRTARERFENYFETAHSNSFH